MSTLVHCHVGEASVQFPESPVCTTVQSNEDLDQSQDLFLSPEAEEEFEHHLSHRRMATGLMDAKLVNNLGETSDENKEDLQSERSKSQAEEENGFSDREEVWENDDDDQNTENPESEANSCTATGTSIITALSFFFLLWQKSFSVSGVAISGLLKFLKMTFVMIGDVKGSELMRTIGNNFPVSLQTVKVLLGIEGNAFKTYVVCPRCPNIALKHYLTAVL